MFKKIFNLYIRYKTKNLKAIPLFVMTFDWKKFQKDGKKIVAHYIQYIQTLQTTRS